MFPKIIVRLSLLTLLWFIPNNFVAHAQSNGCVIPASGPWPPCATGNHVPENSGDNDCVIPASGPWPSCATGNPAPGSRGNNDCVIPVSGPWPPCATGSGGNNPTPPSNNPPTPATGNNVVGNGTAASCTQAALETAVSAAPERGTIRFNCGGAHIIRLNRPLNISKDVTLDGGGTITLDGGQRTGLIETAYYLTVTFRNLTFQNGWTAGQGGALLIGYWSDLTVENNHFINNRALKDTQACDGGGAIFVGGGSVAHIASNTFTGNVANNGGAINNLRSRLTVINNSFDDNHATHSDSINRFGDCGGGGAVYVDGTRKPEDGGPDPIILSNNQYRNNTTNNEGGAIFLAVRAGEQSQITDSLFEGNHATRVQSSANSGNGGAIWYGPGAGGVTGHHLTIEDSHFFQNRSHYQGGAIWIRKGGVTIRNSVITNNTALNPAALGRDDWRKGIGGGVAVADNAFVVLENSDVTHNHAGFVGGGLGAGGAGWIAAANSLIAYNGTDWYQNLQQNCTHALVDRGGNRQFLAGSDPAEQLRRSNCGAAVPLSAQ